MKKILILIPALLLIACGESKEATEQNRKQECHVIWEKYVKENITPSKEQGLKCQNIWRESY